MTNLWHELPSGPDWPEIIYVVVEIPRKSQNKYDEEEDSSCTRTWSAAKLRPGDGMV
jgi:inorganic pyrophosphatase